MPPDLFTLGRMKTPAQRKEREHITLGMNRLLEGPGALVYGNDISRATMRQQDKELQFNASVVALHLERMDILRLQALTATAKMQAINRAKASGFKISTDVLPKIGQKLLIARPVQRRQVFEAKSAGKDPRASPNVEGTIVAISLVGFSCCVQFKNMKGKDQRVWVWPNEYRLLDPKAQTLDPWLECKPTLAWRDVRQHMMEFAHGVEVRWKDTRQLRARLRELGLDDADMRDVEEILHEFELPDVQSCNAPSYCVEVVVQILDYKFLSFLQQENPNLGFECSRDEGEFDKVLVYLVEAFDFKDFMAAASLWRHDRTSRPSLVYPAVLEAISGEKHDCQACFESGKCEAEHVCCRDFMLTRISKLGWVSRRKQASGTLPSSVSH